MILSNKAQKNLPLSVFSFWIKTFIIIYLILLFLVSISEITTALIKSLSYKVNFILFIKPMLLILPSLLSVGLPFVFTITIFLVIRRFTHNNFFKFITIYQIELKYLIGAGLLVSVFLSFIIYSLQENVLIKLDKYIENEIKNIKSRPIASVIEPLGFTQFGDFVFYLPAIPDDSKKNLRLFGHIYKLHNSKVGFVGRGYLVRTPRGNIYLNNVWGFKLDSNGMLRQRIFGKNFSLMHKWMDKKALKNFLSLYKRFISKPDIPLTNQGYKYSYPFPKRLRTFKNLQSALYILSPVIIYLFIIFFLYLIKGSLIQRRYDTFHLILAFFWCIIFLIFPMLTKADYRTKPTFFWYWMICIYSIMIVSVAGWGTWRFRVKNLKFNNRFWISAFSFLSIIQDILNKICFKNNSKNINAKHLKRKLKFQINPYLKAKIRLYIYILKIFFLWILSIHLTVFLFTLIYRIFINWKLNQSMENHFWFMVVQVLDLPEKVLSVSPDILVIMLPLVIYEMYRKRVLPRLILSEGKYVLPIIFVITMGLVFQCGSFFVREYYAFSWKKQANDIYHSYLHNSTKKFNINQLSINSNFLRLSPNSVMFYYQLLDENKKYILKNVILDNVTKDKQLISAAKAKIKKNIIVLYDGNIMNTGRNKIEYFKKKIFRFNFNISDFVFNYSDLKFMNTFFLKQQAIRSKTMQFSSYKYIKGVYLNRISSFVVFWIILIFYLIFFGLNKYDICFQNMLLLALLGFIILTFFVYLVYYL